MAIACPLDLNTAALRSEISNICGRVASEPDGEFHFHRGPMPLDFLATTPTNLPPSHQIARPLLPESAIRWRSARFTPVKRFLISL
jgi:hypothetical protein